MLADAACVVKNKVRTELLVLDLLRDRSLANDFPIPILKTLWVRRPMVSGRLSDLKGGDLTSESETDKRFFVLRGDVQLMTKRSSEDVVSLNTSPTGSLQRKGPLRRVGVVLSAPPKDLVGGRQRRVAQPGRTHGSRWNQPAYATHGACGQSPLLWPGSRDGQRSPK